MSVLFEYNNCSLINHSDYISRVYEKVDDKNEVLSFKLQGKLFCIKNNDTNTTVSKKRKHGQDELSAETLSIKNKYKKFKINIPKVETDKLDRYNVAETIEVRELAHTLFEATNFEHVNRYGGNNNNNPLKCKIDNNYFLIPSNSRFYSGCVKEQCPKLEGNKYDILVADPPWWNKYIRRLKTANDKLSYSMMFNEDIGNLPVKNLLAQNCLVAVWCTNAPSCIEAVKNVIFPSWGVEYLTTWYWLKISIDLEPVCVFSSGCKKQPYERLMIGRVGHVNDVPEDRVIVSVPSALHSHKPPLLDLLMPYINEEKPGVLELFARYLLPNTTSVGYEPLKWQHESLYELVNNKDDVEN